MGRISSVGDRISLENCVLCRISPLSGGDLLFYLRIASNLKTMQRDLRQLQRGKFIVAVVFNTCFDVTLREE